MADTPSMRVLIAGASGLIGTELQRQLRLDGHTVLTLVRRPPRSDHEFAWAPERGELDVSVIERADAVINLSGASIARIPWTRGYKTQILESRVHATSTLARGIAAATTAPRVFLSGSAVGYYGNRPGEVLADDASKGEGFLSDVVAAWESAAADASAVTRTVMMRTGLVVGRGGAMTPLRLLTTVGAAARVGRGTQHWPWISLYDEAAAMRHLLTSGLSGPVNLAGPTPTTSEHMTRVLAAAMRRWHLFALPTGLIGAFMGDAGRELLLASQQQVPTALLGDGFRFRHETVEQAIDELVTPTANP